MCVRHIEKLFSLSPAVYSLLIELAPAVENLHSCHTIDTLLTFHHFTAASPVMETPPSNITVLDGKDATITCRALGAPTPNTTWYFEGRFCGVNLLESIAHGWHSTDGKLVDDRRAQILEVGDLLIASVKSTDAGRYTCVRANEAGKVEESAWVSVLGELVVRLHL